MVNSFARLSEIAMLRTPSRRNVVEKKKSMHRSFVSHSFRENM